MDNISKSLIIAGALFILAGLLWHFTGGYIPFGNLPGDIRIEKENTKIFIPITSSIIVSLLFSLIAYLMSDK